MTPTVCLIATADQALAAGLADRFAAHGVQAIPAATGYGLVEAVGTHRPQAVLVDGDCFGGLLTEVMQGLRLDPATEHLPVVVLQSLVTPADREHARHLRLDGLYVRSPAAADAVVRHVTKLSRMPHPVAR